MDGEILILSHKTYRNSSARKTYLEQIGAYIETDNIDYEKNKSIPKNSCIKWFDYDKMKIRF